MLLFSPNVNIAFMKLAMIINPHAGKKQGLKIADSSAALLRDKGYEIDTYVSNSPGESITLAESLVIDGLDGILAVGGDGTLFEVINGLLKNRDSIQIPIGQIPVGTGNSFIKDLGLDTLEKAIDAVVKGETKGVDLGTYSANGESYYFINLLGTGFVSNVAYRAKRYKIFGSLSYIFGVLEEVAVLKSSPIELNIDGKIIRREAVFTEVCNSKYTGGDMMMAPGAEIDDGLLDVILLNKVNRRKILSLFPSIFKGEHVDDKVIEVFRGKQITLKSEKPLALTPDGETFGTTPLEIDVLNKKIQMYC